MAKKKTTKRTSVAKPAARRPASTPAAAPRAAAKPKAAAVRKPAKHNGSAIAAAPSPAVTHEQIAAKAYEIWLRKGQPRGQDTENWNEAVAELSGAKPKTAKVANQH